MEHSFNDLQLTGLLTHLHDIYGYDFTNYSRASLKRRIQRLYSIDHFSNFEQFHYQLKSDAQYFDRFVEQITVNVTEMFRDPGFFLALKQEVLPVLATYPFIRIWHAGCSTGEEVYSLAILLKEANLLHKSLLYATDINPKVIKKASSGIVPANNLSLMADRYELAGGSATFSNYYTQQDTSLRFNDELKQRIVFSAHNLITDSSFNQFQLILCRNVLIYFEKVLQEQVLALFHDSLERLGFLALGSKETMLRTRPVNTYRQIGKEKIWRKMS